MPNYDASSYDPPAPLAVVTLRNPNTESSVPDIKLLLDTGADMTLLPRNAVERLGLTLIAGLEYELIGFDGQKSVAQAADLDMIFLNRLFRGRYLLIDGDYGVLGRDVLNSVSILLDGPRQQWLEQPR